MHLLQYLLSSITVPFSANETSTMIHTRVACYPLAQASRVVCPYVYIYIYVYKKIVIERIRDLIYLKFVATDFFPKIINLSAGENSGDLA